MGPQVLASADPTPEDPSTGDPPLPWFDRHWTSDAIVQVLGGPGGPDGARLAVETTWPEFGPWLAMTRLIDDATAKAVLLALLWVQTGGTMLPQTEAGSDALAEQVYGPASPAGAFLGNQAPGDGARYRGRGFVPLRGRAAYARYETLLEVPLLDAPDLLGDPTVAAGALVLLFAERGLFPAATEGDTLAVWQGLALGWDGYPAFASATVALTASLAGSGEEVGMALRWQARYEALTEEVEALAEALYGEQRKLEGLRSPPDLPDDKATKKVWIEALRSARRWQQHAYAVEQETAATLSAIADGLVAIGLSSDTEETRRGREEEDEQQQGEGQQ
jgi:hypothetical protein